MWVHFYFVLLYYIHSIKSHLQIFFNSLDILYRLISYNIQVTLAPFFSIPIPFFVTYYCIIQYINNIVFEHPNSIFNILGYHSKALIDYICSYSNLIANTKLYCTHKFLSLTIYHLKVFFSSFVIPIDNNNLIYLYYKGCPIADF
jgi:hypothetical protein